MPNFKMPLPSGARWLVSTEVGGYGCTGGAPWPDTAHQGDNYYSIDFPSPGIKDDGSSYSDPVPVLAPAGGTVQSVGWTSSTAYYIILDHGNGYLTRYIHFDNPAARKNGTALVANDSVNQGDQIGIMGNGGNSTGTHLHINFWYNTTYNGASTVANLSYVVMDGWLLKGFQTECTVDSNGVPTSDVSWKRYYHSSNTPTGN
jgi:murein DD-endopeptidase MepM/ murein hydrolase activator NlpD